MAMHALGAVFAIGLLGAAPAPVAASGERFVLISHAPDSDSWWNTIKNAIKIAAKQMDVKVEYRNPATGDLADMARIVQQAAAFNPDGIIVTIADFNVLSGPVTSAVDRGIPVITINSGTPEQLEKLGALMHIGQPEYDAGFGAGKRAKARGVTKFVCVNHYITNPASVERCKGYADALGVKLGSQMIDSGQDPAEIKNKVIAYLRANPGTNGILTLAPPRRWACGRPRKCWRRLKRCAARALPLSSSPIMCATPSRWATGSPCSIAARRWERQNAAKSRPGNYRI